MVAIKNVAFAASCVASALAAPAVSKRQDWGQMGAWGGQAQGQGQGQAWGQPQGQAQGQAAGASTGAATGAATGQASAGAPAANSSASSDSASTGAATSLAAVSGETITTSTSGTSGGYYWVRSIRTNLKSTLHYHLPRSITAGDR